LGLTGQPRPYLSLPQITVALWPPNPKLLLIA
jgi:hypothetical protein